MTDPSPRDDAAIVAAFHQRTWRWCQRHPALATASASLLVLLVGALVVTSLLPSEWERHAGELEGTLVDAHAERESRTQTIEHTSAGLCVLAWDCWQGGDLPGALAHYEEAIALDPEIGQPYLLQGQVLMQMGRAEDAIAPLRRALALLPAWPGLHDQLRQACVEAGGDELATEVLQQIVDAGATSAEPHVLLAELLHARGDVAGQIGTLRAGLALDPRNERAVAAFVSAVGRELQSEIVSSELTALLEETPDSLPLLEALGMLRAQRHEVEEAVTLLLAVLAIDPDRQAALAALVELLVADEDSDRAVALLAEHVSRHERASRAWEALARLHIDRGEVDAAARAMGRAIALVPTDAWRRFVGARDLAAAGAADAALALAAAGVEVDGAPPEAFERYAAYLLLNGSGDDDATLAWHLARQAVERAARPTPELLATFSEAASRCGREDEAVAAARQALELLRAVAPARPIDVARLRARVDAAEG